MEYAINGYKVKNVPEYAVEDIETKGYVMVARYVDDELWFFGTYPEDKAEYVARNIRGWILKKPN